MPRIRKKTSRRQSTNDRRKIQKKTREGRKKKAKEAKKNPQWKSKQKKDPGIPSDFPYKEQILAEVAQQRRLAAEERERRKEEKKALKTAQKSETEEREENEEEEEHDRRGRKKLNLQIGSDAVAALSAQTISADKLRTQQPADEEEEEEEEAPVLINRELPNLKAVLDEVDVLIEVLDARDPLPYRSRQLEELVAKENKKVLLVLNKIDTCPRESLASWSTYLRSQHPTLLFRSATAFLPSTQDHTASKKSSKGKEPHLADNGLGKESVLECLSHWAQQKSETETLTVGVVGLTNSGKSSFLNTLLGRRALPIYSSTSTTNEGPSTTVLPQEVEIESSGRKLRFVDTPGLSWSSGKDDPLRPRDILLRNKGRIDRLKDPLPAVTHIVSRANPEDLMLLYNLPAFGKGDVTSFLAGIARSRNLVKRKGQLNVDGACKIVLSDWGSGKLPRYTMPPPSNNDALVPEEDDVLKALYNRDDAILATLRTRKEMRKTGGVVKLSASDIECREAEIERPYVEEGDEGEVSEDEDHSEISLHEGEERLESGSSEDSEAEEMEGEEEEMEDLSNGAIEDESDGNSEGDDVEGEKHASSKKQKRKRNLEPADSLPPKKKKVAFAPVTKDSKRTTLTLRGKKTPIAAKKAPIASGKKPKSNTKVANAAGSRSSKAKVDDGEQVYDFGKYF